MDDILDTTYEGKDVALNDNTVKIGDDINITALDPVMHKVLVGVGWDLNAFNADAMDLDISIIMLDKNNLTRMDEDFVFYNQPEAFEGGVKHTGDSRTGAGDGDDESIFIDLHKVPFDIIRILFVLSIYKGREKSQSLGMVRNSYLRLVNNDSSHELLRYNMDKDLEDKMETGMIMASLNREGPKWHFTPIAKLYEDGLAPIAKEYGLIIVDQ